MLISWEMVGLLMVHLNDGILHSYQKKWISAISVNWTNISVHDDLVRKKRVLRNSEYYISLLNNRHKSVRIYTHKYIYTHIKNRYIYTHKYKNIKNTYIHIRKYRCVNRYMQIYVCIDTHIHIRICMSKEKGVER